MSYAHAVKIISSIKSMYATSVKPSNSNSLFLLQNVNDIQYCTVVYII